MIDKILVAGSGTDVGKTIVSAILATLLQADYWKPIQCGDEESSDTNTLKRLIDPTKHCIYPSTYSLKSHLSPHHAARLENICIDLTTITLPQTARSLIIESVGGIFVPLTTQVLSIDLFRSWNCQWILVSKHYLGSINHTLLTIDALKRYGIPILGVAFNGELNLDSETAILEISQVPLLGRLFPEPNITLNTIHKYAQQWRPRLSQLLH
jgi:dethiobiotin synthetase